MKRYKLIKDLPTFKAGETFALLVDGTLISENHHDNDGFPITAYASKTLREFPNVLEDWFEEIEDEGVWKPKYGETYYIVCQDGVSWHSPYFGNGDDKARLAIGNCFKTREDAKRAAEWLRAFKVLRDDTKGFKADGSCENHFVYLDEDGHLAWVDGGAEINSPITFRTPKDAVLSIQEHRKEWLTFFGMEEDQGGEDD